MWQLIPQKLMPPTRVVRYCCAVLKEQGGKGRFITTGVRWAESSKRKNSRGVYEVLGSTPSKSIILNNDNDENRMLFESCRLRAKRVCNPIIDWKDADVWEYIEAQGIPTNPLYQEGFCRVGCIGCPMAGLKGRQEEFARWPKYRDNYIRAFERMLKERERRGVSTTEWDNAMDVFHWWMEDGVLPGQIGLEGILEGQE